MLLTLATALLLGADPESAEATFKKMETTLEKAKSLSTEVEIQMDGGPEKGTLKGRLLVATGNLVRLELAGEMRKKKTTMTLIADGKKQQMASNESPMQLIDVKTGLTELSMGAFSRGGIFLPWFMVTDSGTESKSIKELLVVSDLKLGKKEKVSDVEAQIIEFNIRPQGKGQPIAAQVWVNPKTHLPLKQMVTFGEGKMNIVVTETYQKMTLDAKIDPKEFVISK
jgi:outer membrane lipoprotein-sorting protein